MAWVRLGSLDSCRAREKESTALLWLPNVRGEELGSTGRMWMWMWKRRGGTRSVDVERAQTYVCVTRGRSVTANSPLSEHSCLSVCHSLTLLARD